MVVCIYRLSSMYLPGLEINYKCSDNRFLATCQCPWTRWFWGAGLDHCRVQLTSICFDDPFLFSFAVSTALLWAVCFAHRHYKETFFTCLWFYHSVRMRGDMSQGGSDINAYSLYKFNALTDIYICECVYMFVYMYQSLYDHSVPCADGYC